MDLVTPIGLINDGKNLLMETLKLLKKTIEESKKFDIVHYSEVDDFLKSINDFEYVLDNDFEICIDCLREGKTSAMIRHQSVQIFPVRGKETDKVICNYCDREIQYKDYEQQKTENE